MLCVNRARGNLSDRAFTDLPRLLGENDVLVLNNTKVFPARLIGESETGARIEMFLVHEVGRDIWETLARPAKRLRPGKTVNFDGRLSAEVVEKLPDGKVVVQFSCEGTMSEIVDELGQTPLPPYIHRNGEANDNDPSRYQTVYARNRGAIAAPTAGLHFTDEIIERIKARGAQIAELTLHVGYGTFEPVRVSELSQHRVMPEFYAIDDATAAVLNSAREDGKRIVAVGTTTTRALESNIVEFGKIAAGEHTANLTITPGSEFKIVNALLTNFHLPQSSLLVLTSTFGGHELIMRAYRHAVRERYRFYSYGDCMFIN